MQDALLVLETSCACSSVAVWCENELLWQMEWEAERNHSSAIFEALKPLPKVLEGQVLEKIVVGSGPGAYGNIRVALAVADGLSLVYGSKVVAFPSWNGLGIESENAFVMSDARRGGWTWGKLVNGILSEPPKVVSEEQVRANITKCQENGEPIYSTETAERLDIKGMKGVITVCPSACALGCGWLSLDKGRQEEILNAPLEPLYVRAPHITSSKRPAWAVKA